MLKISIIQRNKSQNSKIWYLRIFDPETKAITYKSLNTTKKGLALELLESENRKRYLTQEERKLETLERLGELAGKWLDYQEKQNNGKTYEIYKGKIKMFLEFCEGNGIESFSDFSTRSALELLNGLQVGANTLKTYTAIFKSFFNWVISTYDLNAKNVFCRAKTPKVLKPITDFWTMDQVARIIDKAHTPEMRLCFSFMAYAGLRVNEALSLRWENIKGETLEIVEGKGGKSAILPMAKSLQDEIARYRESRTEKDNGPIFHTTRDSVSNAIKRACKCLGIDGKAYPHKFRHSFASNLLRAGGNIVAVSKLMRHSSPTITLNTYSHIVPDDLGHTLELLGANNK